MNQEEYHGLIILLLIGLLIISIVILCAIVAPQSFQNMIDKLNDPAQNPFTQVQQAADQIAAGDKSPAYFMLYIGVAGIAVTSALYALHYRLGSEPDVAEPSVADETTRSE